MKKLQPTLFLLLFTFILLNSRSLAQQADDLLNDKEKTDQELLKSEKRKKKIYDAWIKTQDGNTRNDIRLLKAEDSQIVLIPRQVMLALPYEEMPQLIIPYSDIEWIKFRKRDSLIKGVWKGFTIGFGLGFITGMAGGDRKVRNCSSALFFFPWLANNASCPVKTIKAETIATNRGFGLGVLGGSIGGVSGLVSVKFTLENYSDPKTELQPYAIFSE
mgnify:CR=1 FL=1